MIYPFYYYFLGAVMQGANVIAIKIAIKSL